MPEVGRSVLAWKALPYSTYSCQPHLHATSPTRPLDKIRLAIFEAEAERAVKQLPYAFMRRAFTRPTGHVMLNHHYSDRRPVGASTSLCCDHFFLSILALNGVQLPALPFAILHSFAVKGDASLFVAKRLSERWVAPGLGRERTQEGSGWCCSSRATTIARPAGKSTQ